MAQGLTWVELQCLCFLKKGVHPLLVYAMFVTAYINTYILHISSTLSCTITCVLPPSAWCQPFGWYERTCKNARKKMELPKETAVPCKVKKNQKQGNLHRTWCWEVKVCIHRGHSVGKFDSSVFAEKSTETPVAGSEEQRRDTILIFQLSIFNFWTPEETIDWNSNGLPEGVYLKNHRVDQGVSCCSVERGYENAGK